MKPWLSWDDQLDLLAHRGLVIPDRSACAARLSTVNYYRFSGYARYFQNAPHLGENTFVEGTTFDEIWRIYAADADLRALLMPALGRVEVLLRTRYAYVVGRDADPFSSYLDDSYFSGASTSESLAEACRKDLDRSRERFILRYRRPGEADPYATLPVWSAVEAFSFGTLSKCIERGDDGDLHRKVADSLNVARVGFTSRVKELVYLRNRCAHHARLWRHSVVDASSVPNNIKNKAKREVGQFDHRSIMHALISLDDIMHKVGLQHGDGIVFELQRRHSRDEIFHLGLRQPQGHRDGDPTEPA